MNPVATAAPDIAISDALPMWPENAKLGYIVRDVDGRQLRVVVTTDGQMAVDDLGTFEIVDTVRVSEIRAGLRALASGRI
jgi:hypothetical protein